MRLLILLQVIAILEIGKSEDEPNTTIILNDSQTEMTVEQRNSQGGSHSNELFDGLREIESDGNDLDFDYDDGEDTLKVGIKNPDSKEQEMQEVLLKAMRKPAIRKQIGEVIPILRVMSPAQRLTLAALVSSQITSENSLSEENLIELASMFANKKVESTDDRHNITEHLLLPISMDIAKMFKGLGKEVGRNLRQNFYSSHPIPARGTVRRVIRKPEPPSITRRMDEVDYDQSEEIIKPSAEALKQPGKDECDYFTKSLCLEVTNYPTEAIILSLKRNQDIAKTFLTDFEVPPQAAEEGGYDPRNKGSGRRLERRQDGQNEVKDAPSQSGYMCPSSVKYARPKRARTTSGQWKYVVNAGDYTQTLRLEICQKPKSPCSYVTNHLNSECTQIYNYHRLLTWDETKGLHMDVFKVPSCCSCHIQGYSTFFPPGKDFTFAEKRKEPSEAADLIPRESQREGQRPPFGYLGNKREVPQHVLSGSSQTVKNQTQHPLNPKDFYRNPLDHLVPPGPPLPLENEGIFNPYAEATFNQIKISTEQNRRHPIQAQAEFRRTVNKIGEEPVPHKELIPNQRLKLGNPERPKFANPHHPENEAKPIFETGNQIHYLKSAQNTPPPYPSLREKPGSGAVFVTPHSQIHQSVSKTSTKQPSQYFRSEFLDNKSLPSRVNPSYVTPPKVQGIESRVSTTSPPPQKSELLTSSGQRKINYNYHPIIDFFRSDTKRRQSAYPPAGPQYLPLATQDWTPVVGP